MYRILIPKQYGERLMKKFLLIFTIFLLIVVCSLFAACQCVCSYETFELEASCGKDGYVIDHCTKCGKFLIKEKIPMPAEQCEFEQTTIQPTCMKDGQIIKECKHCHKTEVVETIPSLNTEHSYKLYSLCVDEDICGKFVCEDCGTVKHDEVTYTDVGMPILYVDGDLSGMTKDNKVTVALKYESDGLSFASDSTMKWQGDSSLSYPKKNYNIQLLESGTTKKQKVEMKEGWGKESKYTLKANYIDYSQSRNIVSGQLYSQVVHSRDIEDEVFQLQNGGAVDGFPVLIYINGSYHGLYTLNIAKDNLFSMEDDDPDNQGVIKQALLIANDMSDAALLKKTLNSDFTSSHYELEFCSTEDTIGDSWVVESFNNMITFINSNDGENFKNGIGNYVNVSHTIDSMIYTWLIGAEDNFANNILWATYDGVHWFSSMYDMDGTWGMVWNGESYYEPGIFLPLDSCGQLLTRNVLWEKIYENFRDEIVARYFELRKSVLSINNIENIFSSFFAKIPDVVRKAEKEYWTTVPSQDTNNIDQIITFAKAHFELYDEYFAQFVNE